MEAAAPPQRSPRKAKGQGGERREEILAHALRLFGQRGVHAVSTRLIADAVGISQPTLYAYFPSKDALLAAVCAEAFEELAGRTRRAMTVDPGADRLETIGREYIRFGLEHPGRLSDRLHDRGGRPPWSRAVRRHAWYEARVGSLQYSARSYA